MKCLHFIGSSNACDVNVTARTESGSLKPASREANFWFCEALPWITIGLNLQFTTERVRLSRPKRFAFKHNTPSR